MSKNLKPITDRKLRNIGLTLRVAAKAIEQSEHVSDTLWLTDTLTVCDALLMAADEIIEISEQLGGGK